ncbi:uncharacterized protein LOC128234698 [Mya arenaria]|uniref:uncharacterized protein LOC128234698 n=1 Tax=Mya arenaria TaxID=6604 RepID=UPI0022E52D8A|nr:uncharacterized protein LOC128234698 [Mya arenaria]
MFKFQFLIMCALVFGPNYAGGKSAPVFESVHVLNYTDANLKCQDHGGLLDMNLFRSSSLFSGIIENAHELKPYLLLKENVPVWVSGLATSGPYIAPYTCLSLDKHNFAENVTFDSNILYECSVECARKLRNIGFIGITGNTCSCIFESYRFPDNPECEESDFLDSNKGIIVFILLQRISSALSNSLDFNCVSASKEIGGPQYHATKCLSKLSGICSNRKDSSLSSECIPKLNDGEFCFLEENATFIEHIKTCVKYGGALLSVTSDVTEFRNSTVMLGSFREFKAIEDGEENKDMSCVSITKSNEIFYLEKERCSNVNGVICMDDTLDKSGCVSNNGVKTYLLIILLWYLLW